VGAYVARRLLQSLFVLLAVSAIIFLILKAAPGNIAQVMAGIGAKPEDIARLAERLGLHEPWPVQYWRFLTGFVTGDLRSAAFNEPLIAVMARRLLASVELGLVALVLSVLLSVPAGIIAAVRRNSAIDYAVTLLALAGISIPVFWIALMMMISFGSWLRWLPISGRGADIAGLSILTLDGWRHIVIPAASIALIQMAMNARLTRSCLLEVLGQDYITTARSKGVRERTVVLRHALRNALIPVVTNVGLMAQMLFAGAILTETVTAWPGIGRLVYQAIIMRDEPLLFGLTLVIAAFYQLTFLAADLVYAYLNPVIVYD